MKEIVVLSGKGGTGKTSITASFASLANKSILVDCDVDAADLHLILNPEILETHKFSGGKVAVMDSQKCIKCGKCYDLCRYEAIIKENIDGQITYRISDIGCEGCGVCARVCPSGAITMEDAINGEWYNSKTRFGPLVHAKLGVAEENSGKLVTLIRKEAAKIATEDKSNYIIVDGPPGIGCPVIASLTGAQLAIVVTEPSVSGIHDLKRVVKLGRHFKIPVKLIINKCDINPEKTKEINDFASLENIEVLGSIPYNIEITKAQINSKSIVEYSDGAVSQEIKKIWDKITRIN